MNSDMFPMRTYIVVVELKYPGGERVIAERKFLVKAYSSLDAQKIAFKSIKEEFGRKKIIKTCLSCEEVGISW